MESATATLSQINARNAGKLKVAWTMSTGTLRGQEGQPLVIGNMMYFESSYPNFVYAINLDNVGQIVWKFAPEQDKFSPSVACCDLVNKGVAYADGKILVTTLDTHVYALDAKTGKVVWSVQNGDPQLGQTMTIAPLVVHDKVIVGISGGEYGVRGYLTALRSQDRQAGLAREQRRPGQGHSVRSGQDHRWSHATTGGQGFQSQDLERGRVEARRRHHVGLVHLRSPAQSGLLRQRQSGNVESLRSGRATTNGPPRCSRAIRIPEWPRGRIR